MLADESDFLELLVASERIDQWLHTIATGAAPQRKQAVLQLAEAVCSREAYADEARTAGVVEALTKLLPRTDDEEVLSACAAALAACSGPAAQPRRLRQVQCGPHALWVREGALSEGLGARLWASAHILCRQLVASPELVRGLDVLELGSGCGLVGILAAKLGAQQVTLTDYDASVLANLWACVARNSAGADAAQDGAAAGWEADTMRVRYLDWSEALPSAQAAALRREDAVIGRDRGPGEPPALEAGRRFPLIIGTDLLYELYQADMVAAVTAQRLSREGAACLALAVRRKAHLQRLIAEAARHGLAAEVQAAEVGREEAGILGQEHEYEGGFVTACLRFQQQQQPAA